MKVRDICSALEAFAPPYLACDWDHIGLSVGDFEWDVSRVLVALTVTPEVAKAAIRGKANLIVSHHPVIWEPLRALRTDDPHVRMCLQLAQARVACFAAHTNLDIAPGGVNDTLAKLLGLVSCQPLFPAPNAEMLKLVTFVPESHLAAVRDAVCEAGAGVIGEYTHCTFSSEGAGTFLPGAFARPYSGKRGCVSEEPERRFEVLVPKARIAGVLEAMRDAHPYEEVAYDLVRIENTDETIGLGVRGELPRPTTLGAFCEHVRAALGVGAVRYIGDPKRRIRRVAALGGSGGGELGGLPRNIDVYVTGDVGYHDALTAQERGVCVVDAGHDGTERCIVPVLAGLLKRRFRGLRVSTRIDADLFRCHIK